MWIWVWVLSLGRPAGTPSIKANLSTLSPGLHQWSPLYETGLEGFSFFGQQYADSVDTSWINQIIDTHK